MLMRITRVDLAQPARARHVNVPIQPQIASPSGKGVRPRMITAVCGVVQLGTIVRQGLSVQE